ncbi:hypothetical protein [Moorena sp. SIO3H5]|uniref:hypothetical protein n=1 Tax=Moorena sp. SIO3H5 TaxID=2607834 RepID=UPI0013B9B2C8|nr:hypothetical protein [Moorena sp. SIO3H5]NEO72112.1 hypothetical protein [Moorena sp. SIO3H5]
MKQEWNTPKLKTYGSVEEVTAVGVKDIGNGVVGAIKIGKFLLPKGLGLFASLHI